MGGFGGLLWKSDGGAEGGEEGAGRGIMGREEGYFGKGREEGGGEMHFTWSVVVERVGGGVLGCGELEIRLGRRTWASVFEIFTLMPS